VETYDDSRVRHDIAQICENGHVITTMAKGIPEKRQPFCDRCGAPTLMECRNCQKAIRGESNAMYDSWRFPGYCPQCGSAYPWTEKNLAAAADLIDLEAQLSAQAKAELKKDLGELGSDSPRSKVAALKMAKFIKVAAPEIGTAMREIVVSVASEAVKKQMGL